MTYTSDWHVVTAVSDATAANGLQIEVHHNNDCPVSSNAHYPICPVGLEVFHTGFGRPEWAVVTRPGTYRARVLLDDDASRLEVEPTDPGDTLRALLDQADADGVR